VNLPLRSESVNITIRRYARGSSDRRSLTYAKAMSPARPSHSLNNSRSWCPIGRAGNDNNTCAVLLVMRRIQSRPPASGWLQTQAICPRVCINASLRAAQSASLPSPRPCQSSGIIEGQGHRANQNRVGVPCTIGKVPVYAGFGEGRDVINRRDRLWRAGHARLDDAAVRGSSMQPPSVALRPWGTVPAPGVLKV
jgi:hypothetical protein